jgi:beta-N-acetylhexosaminidase
VARRVALVLTLTLALTHCAAPEPIATARPGPTPTSPPPSPSPRGGRSVEQVLLALSLEEKVAQLVIAYPPGGDDPVDLGGVVLLGRMLRDPVALRARIEGLQRRARLPLLVAVDLEGGELNRFKGLRTLSALPSARDMGEE